jgi:PKD repeat protein
MSCFDSYIQNCNENLTAAFQVDNNQICAGTSVQFEDNSQGNILVWEWHFEGGIPEFSNDMNPVVTYDEAGLWDVSLIVSNDLYSDTLNFAAFVEVFANPDVTLQPFDEVCENNPPFMLTGGFPEGGEYSGPGVEDGWFYPEIAGVGEHLITYSYEDDNGCSGTAEEILVVDMCTSVTEIRNLDFDVYPTPTTGELFIRPYFSGKIEIQLVDLTGMKVYETSSFVQAGEPLKLDIRHLSSGFYLLRVSNGEDSFSSKVVLTPGQ